MPDPAPAFTAPRPPRVRVFLLTFHRPHLLPRALASLRAQSFTDWVCEVHNGDPADSFPSKLLAQVADPRLRLVLPEHPTGPVEAFNLAHRPVPEEFQSILEDDNSWEPTFLATMITALDARPSIELAWCNQRISTERPDGSWHDAGRCVWTVAPDSPARLFSWPQLIQFNDFLHANGCMLLRSRTAPRLIMPADTPRDMIEHTRERMMDFPVLFVPAPLATFSVTVDTFRSRDFLGWGRAQALLGAAFLIHVPLDATAARALWAQRRALRPRSTSSLFFAAFLAGRPRFLAHATLGDICAFLLGCARRPLTACRIFRAKTDLPAAWRHLTTHTAARTAEARARGFVTLTADSLLEKKAPGRHGL